MTSKLIRFGPAVRMLLNQHNLSPADIFATGPKGTILKSDVLATISARKLPVRSTSAATTKQQQMSSTTPATKTTTTVTNGKYIDLPVDSMMKEAGSIMVTGKFVSPHAYQTVDINLSYIDSLITPLVEQSNADRNILRISCFVKAIMKALKDGALKDLNITSNLAIAFTNSKTGVDSFSILSQANNLSVSAIAAFLNVSFNNNFHHYYHYYF